MSQQRHRVTVAVVSVVRAVGVAGALGACAATTADPQVYAELALREDAREAAMAVEPRGGDPDDRLRMDTTAIAAALGHARRLPGGMYEVRLPGAGVAVFHPAGGGQAALTGDVVRPAGAVPATVRALASYGIAVTNVRADSLATTDAVPGQPGQSVLHIWALRDAGTVARGLQAALQIAPVETARR